MRKVLLMLSMLSAGCATARYPLNLSPDAEIAPTVCQKARGVDGDLPAADTEDRRIAQGLLDAVREGSGSLDATLAERLVADDVGLAFETSADGAPAFHEMTAGLIDLPFATFLERFEPAREWGRNLARYLGGELAVDRADDGERASLQRERMVVGMPWYAVGGPDMDMSKYEVIERASDSATVLWFVAVSENKSVSHDEGYLIFKKVEAGGRERTLVFFNSVHQIDSGWLGGLLPSGARSSLTQSALRDTFLAHIESYRRVAGSR